MQISEKNFPHADDKEVDLKKSLISVWREKFLVTTTVTVSLILSILFLENYTQETYSARAVFGFNDQSKQTFSSDNIPGFSNIFGLQKSNENTMTQITGRDFLRQVVLDLGLTKDTEFFKPQKPPENLSVSYFIMTIKDKLGKDTTIKKLTEKEVLEFVVSKLKGHHLSISDLSTGGIEIIVTSIDPKKAAKIANKIAKNYIELRLKEKISKSEKTLQYLSEKLSESRAEMVETNKKVEIFALQQNVLSNQEFAEQSNRLKEFRNTLDELELKLEKLGDLSKILEKSTAEEVATEVLVKNLVDLSPRLKSIKPFRKKDGSPDHIKEIKYIKTKLPNEISRLEDSLRVTTDGFNKLEKKAKETSKEARALKTLQMNANFATTRYQGLVKEFENQSIIEGFKEAMGEMYETASPPLSPSGPKSNRIIGLFVSFGFFLGIGLALIKSSITNKMWYKDDFEDTLNIDGSVLLSRRPLNIRNILRLLIANEFSPALKKDLLLLQGAATKINQTIDSAKPITITCASSGNQCLSVPVAFLIAHLFNLENRRVLLEDFTKKSVLIPGLFKKLGLKTEDANKRIFEINNNLTYIPKIVQNKIVTSEEKELLKLNTQYAIIIRIVDCMEKEPKSIQEVVNSNYFLLISRLGKTKITDLERIGSALRGKISNCLAGIIIST